MKKRWRYQPEFLSRPSIRDCRTTDPLPTLSGLCERRTATSWVTSELPFLWSGLADASRRLSFPIGSFSRCSIKTGRRCLPAILNQILQQVQPRQMANLLKEIKQSKTGHFERHGNLYSFSPIESTGWVAVVEQPRTLAYKPVHDLLGPNDSADSLAGWPDDDIRVAWKPVLSTPTGIQAATGT